MSYDRILRWSAFGFGLFFALVVALGFIPALNQGMDHVSMSASGEHQMMGLYMIGAADDVTHGLTAVVFLLAAALSAAASRVTLLAFGWYYAIDASIYLITGVVQHKPVLSNILLNIPHVVLSAIMLSLAYRRSRGLSESRV
jgi:predicted anti-sigma-YlaC factor YlaD